MKILVTPDFTEKVRAAGEKARVSIASAVAKLEFISAKDWDGGKIPENVTELPGDIYMARADGVRVIFASLHQEGETHLLLVDLIDETGPPPAREARYARRDPRSNTQFNPQVNTQLNPNVNTRINPNVNTKLNPMVNTRLNPNVNSQLNPIVNSRLNYRVNSRLNPLVNSKLNPRVNSMINPRVNYAFGGPFLYDMSLNKIGFTVQADEHISIVFSMDGSMSGISVLAEQDVYILFDRDNSWIGHLIPAGNGVFVRYDRKNQWIGLML